ncbi:DNA (cytosine-5-)-methyltransferase [Microbacterium sp. NPDC055521]
MNDLAVHQIVSSVREPLVLAHAVSLLTEKALHTHIDPRTDRAVRNLSGSKRAGTFFTPPRISQEMATYALQGRDEIGISLEPASGTAALSVSLIAAASHAGVSIQEIVAWEMSEYLAKLSEIVLNAVVERLNSSTRITVRAGDAIARFAKDAIYPDLVIMNPPYGRVKYLASEATNAETRAANTSAAINAGRDWARSTQARYAGAASNLGLRERGLDHQRVFMAAAMNSLNHGGRMVCIAPSTWMSGPQSKDIREILLSRQRVERIVLYPEDAKLFPTVNQPTAIVVADQSMRHEGIEIVMRSRSPEDSSRHTASYHEILNAPDRQMSVPLMKPEMRNAFIVASQLPRLASQNIKNARGELDLTADKWMLSNVPNNTRVIRGDQIERYRLFEPGSSAKAGFISQDGLATLRKRAKWPDTQAPRIVGRQVAYMGKSRRLSFTEVPSGQVVANSCNYLLASNQQTHFALLGYLNSTVAEWWFRLHNSNNHVSNGELATLPWPFADASVLEAVAAAASLRLDSNITNIGSSTRLEQIIDALICYGTGLTPASARPVLAGTMNTVAEENVLALLEQFRKHGVPRHLLRRSTWMQHELNTLSALDYEMIRHVPAGGNWQNIPESVPSQRLAQIREMSAQRGIVRTTYYGRLRADQPSYTIATYYNRPGNGTNIHPYEDRTLSHREAARLQSFPDSYGFIGGDGAIRTQIGNAVPPLLGHAVAKRLREAGVEDGPVVDLFAGAGGLSLGFELAGMDVAVAADNNPAALRTYAFNRPTEPIPDPGSTRTLLVEADLSNKDVREGVYESIRQKLAGRQPSVLAGGPPCQGFSYAGFRDPNDPRSDLAVAFLDFVEALNPHAVVLENVEGLLTSQGGRVAAELISTLNDLGYPVTSPWLLAAEQYGVPQMRRRVFLVAMKGAPVSPPAPVFDRCKGRREDQSVSRNGSYPVTSAEAFLGLPSIVARSSRPRLPARTAYSRWASGELDADTYLIEHASSKG